MQFGMQLQMEMTCVWKFMIAAEMLRGGASSLPFISPFPPCDTAVQERHLQSCAHLPAIISGTYRWRVCSNKMLWAMGFQPVSSALTPGSFAKGDSGSKEPESPRLHRKVLFLSSANGSVKLLSFLFSSLVESCHQAKWDSKGSGLWHDW